jgi:uncharacterized membrane protein (DUF2068 family)
MQSVAESATKIHHPGDRPLMWIAAYNLGKGLLLFTITLALLGLLHKDVDTIVGQWMSALGVNLENEHVASLLDKLDKVHDHQLKVFSGFTGLFSLVFLVEGVGLFFKQRWAEYLTIIVTASFIPVEIFETVKHFGMAKCILLTVNIVIVACLIWILKKNPKPKHEHERVVDEFSSSVGKAPIVALAATVVPAVGQKVGGPS